jgi:hypothetical protein
VSGLPYLAHRTLRSALYRGALDAIRETLGDLPGFEARPCARRSHEPDRPLPCTLLAWYQPCVVEVLPVVDDLLQAHGMVREDTQEHPTGALWGSGIGALTYELRLHPLPEQPEGSVKVTLASHLDAFGRTMASRLTASGHLDVGLLSDPDDLPPTVPFRGLLALRRFLDRPPTSGEILAYRTALEHAVLSSNAWPSVVTL